MFVCLGFGWVGYFTFLLKLVCYAHVFPVHIIMYTVYARQKQVLYHVHCVHYVHSYYSPCLLNVLLTIIIPVASDKTFFQVNSLYNSDNQMHPL